MSVFKRFLLVAAFLVILPVMAIAQPLPGLGGGAMTVEQMYLQESIEMMIIREQSRGDNRDMKFVALEFINDALERGVNNPEIHATLEFLSFEGIVNMTRESGRVVNNFPDVRARSAAMLGQLGTPEAVSTLVTIVSRDNEPMVLTEAIRALGNIGSDPTGEVIETIAWTVHRFSNLNPNNLLALSAIEAIERISEAQGGMISPVAVQTLIRISEGTYIRPVQQRARLALSELRRTN